MEIVSCMGGQGPQSVIRGGRHSCLPWTKARCVDGTPGRAVLDFKLAVM